MPAKPAFAAVVQDRSVRRFRPAEGQQAPPPEITEPLRPATPSFPTVANAGFAGVCIKRNRLRDEKGERGSGGRTAGSSPGRQACQGSNPDRRGWSSSCSRYTTGLWKWTTRVERASPEWRSGALPPELRPREHARLESNQRPPPSQGGAPPLSYGRE